MLEREAGRAGSNPESTPDAVKLSNRANTDLQAATVFLLNPDARNLDRSRALLEDAAKALTSLQASDPGQESLPLLHELRRKVRVADQLLQSAAAFYAGTSIALGRLSGIYATGGRMRQPTPASRVSLEC